MTGNTAAIVAIGYALPDLRVTAKEGADAWGHAPRGVTQRAVPAFDEDAVTLAAAAARRAFAASGRRADEVGLVIVATGGAETAAGTVAEIVGAKWARALDVTGRGAAGVAALVTGFDTVNACGNTVLVVAADVPRAAPGDPAEQAEGAGAAAFVIAPGDGVRLAAAGAATTDLPGTPALDAHGTLRSPDVLVDDPGLVARALADAAPVPAQPDFLVQHPARARVTDGDGKPLAPARAAPGVRTVIGDAGAAAAPLELVALLADATPGREGVIAVADAGRAVALRLDVAAKPAGEGAVTAAAEGGRHVGYLRALQERRALLADAGIPDAPMGAYVSLPDYARSLPERYRLEGEACESCGTVAFPKRAACAKCGGRVFKDVALSGRGRVHAATVIGRGGAPSEFAAEQAMTGAYRSAIVELEEGPRVGARLTGFGEDVDVAPGTPVTAVLRRLYAQQGVVRYGFKFAPVG